MLETLRDRKRCVVHKSMVEYNLIDNLSEQLSQFAVKVVSSAPSAIENKMEIDSMASTPFHE